MKGEYKSDLVATNAAEYEVDTRLTESDNAGHAVRQTFQHIPARRHVEGQCTNADLQRQRCAYSSCMNCGHLLISDRPKVLLVQCRPASLKCLKWLYILPANQIPTKTTHLSPLLRQLLMMIVPRGIILGKYQLGNIALTD